MSIFTKPLSQLATTDLQELLTDKAVENARLEFKSEVPGKEDTLKKLSSFANTFGGFMVVGAKANSSDGRIDGLPGVDEQPGYKQKIVDWCFAGASPPLIAEVSDPIPVPAKGKVCYVIYTAESDVAPHFLNGRKGIWVRTDEFSARFEARLADENELRHLLDRRKLIRARRDNLLERAKGRYAVYAAGKGTKVLPPRLQFCVVPRFPARPLCEQGGLNALIMKNYARWRGVIFPNPSPGPISQHESALVLGATAEPLSIFEVNVWGMLFYCTKIAHDYEEKWGIHLGGFVGHILLFMQHSDIMLRALGYSGPIHIEIALSSIRGAPWLYGPYGALSRAGSVLDDEVSFAIVTSGDALHEKSGSIAMDILKYVFFSVNCPDLIDTRQKLEDLVRNGYVFNNWTPPEKLT